MMAVDSDGNPDPENTAAASGVELEENTSAESVVPSEPAEESAPADVVSEIGVAPGQKTEL